MSLTNPKAPVTEERLAEFYQSILPYLGGMPEMVANKFSRGDIYSTDEKMIGQWIDGKPIYQKVYNNIAVSPSANEFDVASLNIDNIVSMNGKYVYNNDFVYNFSHVDPNGGLTYACDLFFRKSTNKITFLIGSAINTGNVSILILQYTKTTDSAISIGADTDYSTTEKIVGTWIDGKPLWQKVLTGTLDNSGILSIDVSNLSIDNCYTLQGTISNGDINTFIPYFNDTMYYMCVAYYDKNNAMIKIINKNYTNFIYKIIIQYTKTN